MEIYQACEVISRKAIFSGNQRIGLDMIVNYFTYYVGPIRAEISFFACDNVPYSRQVPHRTVRRVHVAPSSTSIQRIGYARLYSSGGDDNSASGGYRRR